MGYNLAYPSGSSKPIARQDQTVTIELQKVESKGGIDKIVVKKKSFQVKGILEELGSQEIDSVAFVSLPAANALFEKGGYYDAIYVITIDPEENDAVEERIREIYGKNIGITSPKALAETIGDVMGAWNVFVSTIASVSMFVGAVGIVTTLYTSVMDRTREIGLLKAIGYGNKSILFMFSCRSYGNRNTRWTMRINIGCRWGICSSRGNASNRSLCIRRGINYSILFANRHCWDIPTRIHLKHDCRSISCMASV